MLNLIFLTSQLEKNSAIEFVVMPEKILFMKIFYIFNFQLFISYLNIKISL